MTSLTTWTTPLQASMSVAIISGMFERGFPAPFWKILPPEQTVRLSSPLAISIFSVQWRSDAKTSSPATAWNRRMFVKAGMSSSRASDCTSWKVTKSLIRRGKDSVRVISIQGPIQSCSRDGRTECRKAVGSAGNLGNRRATLGQGNVRRSRQQETKYICGKRKRSAKLSSCIAKSRAIRRSRSRNPCLPDRSCKSKVHHSYQ